MALVSFIAFTFSSFLILWFLYEFMILPGKVILPGSLLTLSVSVGLSKNSFMLSFSFFCPTTTLLFLLLGSQVISITFLSLETISDALVMILQSQYLVNPNLCASTYCSFCPKLGMTLHQDLLTSTYQLAINQSMNCNHLPTIIYPPKPTWSVWTLYTTSNVSSTMIVSLMKVFLSCATPVDLFFTDLPWRRNIISIAQYVGSNGNLSIHNLTTNIKMYTPCYIDLVINFRIQTYINLYSYLLRPH